MGDHWHDVARARALRKEEKAMMKANETLEEKRLRRLAKKEAKERKRKQLLGCEDYTNRDNPFGDANLEATFVWSKKYQKEGREVDQKEIIRENRRNLEETRKELEQVKQRRLEREKEWEARQEEMAASQREKEMEHFKVFEKQEDTFHLKQARLRSKIRIRDGRAKPIDHLAQYYDTFAEKQPDEEPKTEEEQADEENYLLSHIPEPYKVLNGLRRIDLEDLVEDIKVYMELEKERDLSFWKDMLVIVQDELVKLKNYADGTHERREGISAAVAPNVNRMFEGKTPAELSELQIGIERKINSGDEGIDISFWETVLSKLKALIARARLRELHGKNMEIRCQRLKIIRPKDEHESSSHSTRNSDHHSSRHRHHRDRDRGHDDKYRDDRKARHADDSKRGESFSGSRHRDHDLKTESQQEQESSSHRSKEDPDVRDEGLDAKDSEDPQVKSESTETRIKQESSASPDYSASSSASHEVEVGQEVMQCEEEVDDEMPGGEEDVIPELSLLDRCKREYSEGRYSPPLLSFHEVDQRAIVILLPEQDDKVLHEMRGNLFVRNQIRGSTSATPVVTSAESAFENEARKGMSQDEVQFSVEEVIRQDKSVAGWAGKYKPRKPRYFNRVHTGFEWNKYNQTHYDVDNPPPKIVQGYKFNLFYPDLIDKSRTPKYTITPCKDNREFAIIRFSAGPPYEDIAFKIVNREWNFSYRSGFRSQFSNGILQLWFHFKRYRYRR